MRIYIHQRRTAVAIDRDALSTLASRLSARAFGPDTAPYAELSIVIVGDGDMPACKERVFGVRRQTDVISLAYVAIPGIQPATAELVINVERAVQEGANRPGGPARELALYLAHGLDHLAGHDDDSPAARRSMRRRETRWLDAEGESGWSGILRP